MLNALRPKMLNALCPKMLSALRPRCPCRDHPVPLTIDLSPMIIHVTSNRYSPPLILGYRTRPRSLFPRAGVAVRPLAEAAHPWNCFGEEANRVDMISPRNRKRFGCKRGLREGRREGSARVCAPQRSVGGGISATRKTAQCYFAIVPPNRTKPEGTGGIGRNELRRSLRAQAQDIRKLRTKYRKQRLKLARDIDVFCQKRRICRHGPGTIPKATKACWK